MKILAYYIVSINIACGDILHTNKDKAKLIDFAQMSNTTN